jgi:hypothetical protein
MYFGGRRIHSTEATTPQFEYGAPRTIDIMTTPRYDEEEDISRHAAVDANACLEMESNHKWKLKRIEVLPTVANQVFEVDCVFEGKTEFPKSYYETNKAEDDA